MRIWRDNARGICWENTRLRLVLEYSLNIPQVHYHAINAQDEV